MQKTILSFIYQSGWVLVFAICCAILYEQGLKQRSEHYQQLYERLNYLQQTKKEALKQQHHLILQVNSQSDPAWIELVLLKGLGLVPEDQQKVFFQKNISELSSSKN